MMKKFNIIILAVVILVLIFTVSLYILDMSNVSIKIEKAEIITEVKEAKPSYEYLKSITVYITGSIPSIILEDDTTRIGEKWSGTGSIIKIDEDYTYILTNAHVAGEKKTETVLFIDNDLEKIEAEIVAFHQNSNVVDLAVLKVKGKLKNKQVIKGFDIAYPQDKLYLVGHHLGRKYVYGEGVFAGYDDIYDIIQIPTLYGNSGSAVCNSEGKLVGVIFAINRVGFFGVDCAHGLSVSGLSIRLFLEKLGLL